MIRNTAFSNVPYYELSHIRKSSRLVNPRIMSWPACQPEYGERQAVSSRLGPQTAEINISDAIWSWHLASRAHEWSDTRLVLLTVVQRGEPQMEQMDAADGWRSLWMAGEDGRSLPSKLCNAPVTDGWWSRLMRENINICCFAYAFEICLYIIWRWTVWPTLRTF